MPARDIVFLGQTRVDQRDHDRFGVAILGRRGHRVRFWSFAKVFTPALFEDDNLEEPTGDTPTTYFENLEEACRAAGSLSPDAVLILCMGADPSLEGFFQAVAASGAAVMVLLINMLPDEADAPEVLGLADRMCLLRAKVRRITPKTLSQWFASRENTRRQALPPARFLVVGGAKGMHVPHPLVIPGTEVIKAHALDYDLFLEETCRGPRPSTPTAVFLDDAVINNPLFLIHGSNRISLDHYLATLRRLFDCVEERYGLEVVVAAHPRVDYSQMPGCFGRRRVAYKKTLELTRSAQLVISQCSTSINFAVLCRKPILIIATADILRRYAPLVLTTAAVLKVPFIRAEQGNLRRLPATLEINEAAYQDYQHRYIKQADSPDKPFWEIVADRFAG
jgi:hypothetical protein